MEEVVKKPKNRVSFFFFKQLLLFVVCNALIHRSHISGTIEYNSGQSEFYFFWWLSIMRSFNTAKGGAPSSSLIWIDPISCRKCEHTARLRKNQLGYRWNIISLLTVLEIKCGRIREEELSKWFWASEANFQWSLCLWDHSNEACDPKALIEILWY